MLVTDGIVADVPDNPAALGFNAPIHALITGEENEHDRRIVLDRAPRFAILNEPQSIQDRVLDTDLPPGTARQRQAQGGRDRGGRATR